MAEERKQIEEIIAAGIFQALVDTHTIAIAKITKVGTKTISCQPVINRLVNGESIRLPEFTEVPPIFMQGGGSYTAHPIAVGDYCLLLFSERCFDTWYNGEDFKIPAELRMHDYSDGFALVGVNPLAGALTIPIVIQQTGDTNQDGDYTHQGNMARTGNYTQTGTFDLTGDMTVVGDVDASTFSVGGVPGATGVFISADAKTVTVVNGIITSIV